MATEPDNLMMNLFALFPEALPASLPELPSQPFLAHPVALRCSHRVQPWHRNPKAVFPDGSTEPSVPWP